MASLAGKKIVITAGPTREALDPVRFLSNASSGRMGYALAREARRLKARTVLISGPTALPAPAGVKRVSVTSARDMLRAARKEARGAHAFIAAAAVADWRPAAVSRQKMKSAVAAPTLRLQRNPDVLKTLSLKSWKRRPFFIGFALENRSLLSRAAAKLRDKRLDLVVANSPAAIESPVIRAWLLAPARPIAAFRGPKEALARLILNRISP